MSIINYNKLVRDRIPEIISNDSNTEVIKLHRINNKDEFIDVLLLKLIEESCELKEACLSDKANVLKELADMHEVLDEILNQFGYSKDELQEARKTKAEQRGLFKDKIYLESVQTRN